MLLAPGAAAGAWIVRDHDRRVVETIEERIGDRLIGRDADGARIGSIEPWIGDPLAVRGKDGGREFVIEEGIGGALWVREFTSRERLYRIRRGIGDRLVITDRRGRRGTIGRD